MPTSVTTPEDTEEKPGSPGPAVRTLRLQRRMSQRMLAARSGIDPSTISRLERGIANTMTVTVLTRLAAGLGCTPEELIVRPSAVGGRPAPTQRPENLIELQRALIGTSLDTPGLRRAQLGPLVDQIALVRQLRVSGQYRHAAAAAARWLPDAHAAATASRERKPARVQLTHLCFDAAMSARLLDDLGTAWIAAERAQEAATLTRQIPLIAGATFARAYVALGRVVPSRARQIIESFTNGMSPKSPEVAALLGMLHLAGALAISRSRGGIVDRDRHLAHAERMLPLAEGDTDPFALNFSHENMWQWRMNIGLETRNRAMAADALTHIRLEKIVEPHRQAVYFVDLARLYVSSGRWEGAVGLLARADRLAPDYIANHRAAQQLRDYLNRRERSEAIAS